jgi:16S rRNA (cytidine1402-2'-O)-methyltransferase
MSQMPTVYLIPSFLDEHSIKVLPDYILDKVKECQVFFTENERSSRRYLKGLWKEMVIDQYEWFTIGKTESAVLVEFRKKLKEGKTIGILSEAGCPGVADPGQLLVEAAQEAGAIVRPIVGPNAILLALMGSGMNGQHFQFVGYLPIELPLLIKKLKELETESQKKNCTQLFIETPYRNNQLLETIVKTCKASTKLCIAANLTAPNEYIRSKSIAEWKNLLPELHKQPAIFLLHAAKP